MRAAVDRMISVVALRGVGAGWPVALSVALSTDRLLRYLLNIVFSIALSGGAIAALNAACSRCAACPVLSAGAGSAARLVRAARSIAAMSVTGTCSP